MYGTKAEIENIEMEALRHQVIDLQTQTDEKVNFHAILVFISQS